MVRSRFEGIPRYQFFSLENWYNCLLFNSVMLFFEAVNIDIYQTNKMRHCLMTKNAVKMTYVNKISNLNYVASI